MQIQIKKSKGFTGILSARIQDIMTIRLVCWYFNEFLIVIVNPHGHISERIHYFYWLIKALLLLLW